jgi:hypothetical protein
MNRPKRVERVLDQLASDDLVLLELDRGTYYSLNTVGARVWELCDGSRDVEGIVAMIADEFDAGRETIQGDVMELLEELTSEKLVVFSV